MTSKVHLVDFGMEKGLLDQNSRPNFLLPKNFIIGLFYFEPEF